LSEILLALLGFAIVILGIFPMVYVVGWGVMFCIWLGDLIKKGKDEEE
jgi:hypothetical protein